MNIKLAREILEDMLSRVVFCKHCDGTGFETKEKFNACGVCGGLGEVMEGWVDIPSIKEALHNDYNYSLEGEKL